METSTRTGVWIATALSLFISLYRRWLHFQFLSEAVSFHFLATNSCTTKAQSCGTEEKWDRMEHIIIIYIREGLKSGDIKDFWWLERNHDEEGLKDMSVIYYQCELSPVLYMGEADCSKDILRQIGFAVNQSLAQGGLWLGSCISFSLS